MTVSPRSQQDPAIWAIVLLLLLFASLDAPTAFSQPLDAQDNAFASNTQGSAASTTPDEPAQERLSDVSPTFERYRAVPSELLSSVVERELEQTCGLIRSTDPSPSGWQLSWSEKYPPSNWFENLSPTHRVNHFPGIAYLTMKPALAAQLASLEKKFQYQFDFMPKSFVLPLQWETFVSALQYRAELKGNPQDLNLALRRRRTSTSKTNRTSVVEPTFVYRKTSSKRWRVVPNFAKLEKLYKANKPFVVEELISPHLIEGYKYEVGVYVLLTSVNPLRAYVFQDGLVRFCTKKYPDSRAVFVRAKESFLLPQKYGSMWDRKVFSRKNASTTALFALETRLNQLQPEAGSAAISLMHDEIRKSLIAAAPSMASVNAMHKAHPGNFFELLRFDFLLDRKLKPWLVNVQMSPQMSHDHPADQDAVVRVLRSSLQLVGVTPASESFGSIGAVSQLYEDVVARSNAPYCRKAPCNECPDDTRCALCEQCISKAGLGAEPSSRDSLVSRKEFVLKQMMKEQLLRDISTTALLYPSTLPALFVSPLPRHYSPAKGERMTADDHVVLSHALSHAMIGKSVGFSYVFYLNQTSSRTQARPSAAQRDENWRTEIQHQVAAERLQRLKGFVTEPLSDPTTKPWSVDGASTISSDELPSELPQLRLLNFDRKEASVRMLMQQFVDIATGEGEKEHSELLEEAEEDDLRLPPALDPSLAVAASAMAAGIKVPLPPEMLSQAKERGDIDSTLLTIPAAEKEEIGEAFDDKDDDDIDDPTLPTIVSPGHAPVPPHDEVLTRPIEFIQSEAEKSKRKLGQLQTVLNAARKGGEALKAIDVEGLMHSEGLWAAYWEALLEHSRSVDHTAISRDFLDANAMPPAPPTPLSEEQEALMEQLLAQSGGVETPLPAGIPLLSSLVGGEEGADRQDAPSKPAAAMNTLARTNESSATSVFLLLAMLGVGVLLAYLWKKRAKVEAPPPTQAPPTEMNLAGPGAEFSQGIMRKRGGAAELQSQAASNLCITPGNPAQGPAPL